MKPFERWYLLKRKRARLAALAGAIATLFYQDQELTYQGETLTYGVEETLSNVAAIVVILLEDF